MGKTNFKKFKEMFEENKLAFLYLGLIIFAIFLNIFVYLYIFNSSLKGKNPHFYQTLERYTNVKTLGPLALKDKKVSVQKKLVNVTKLTIVQDADFNGKTAIFGLDLVVLIIVLFAASSKKKSTIQGSARWGGMNDLKLGKGKEKYFGASLLNQEGVILGTFKNVTLRDNAKTHICVVAPTRTGKGVSLIIPTLTKGWRESTVVLDIKGENYQLSSGARKELHDNLVIRFAPKSYISASFNPLAEIRFLQEEESSDIALITDIITADDSAKDKFWPQSASKLLTGSISYIGFIKFLKNPTYKIVNGQKQPIMTATLGEVADFFTDTELNEGDGDGQGKSAFQMSLLDIALNRNAIEEYGKDEETKEFVRKRLLELYPLETQVINNGNHPAYVKEFIGAGGNAGQTFGSILSTTEVAIRVFRIAVVRKNTSTSDFTINDLMNYQRPVSLYLVIPPADIIVLKPLLKIFLTQVVTLLTGEMDYANQSGHKWRMLMLLDEFPAVGKIEILEEAIGYLAGYGIKVMIILQSLDQLYKIYKKENGFLSNCQTQVFYTSNDDTTANYVSKLLGDTTIVKKKVSRNLGTQGGGSTSDDDIKRPLLLPDEVGRFPSDKIIVKISGRNPVQSNKIVYFEEKEYKDAAKIPYIYPESCYDKSKQYILLTSEQKKLNPEYPYKYFPYVDALKVMKKDLALLKKIIETTDERKLDEKDAKEFERLKENYDKQRKGFFVYMKMFNILKPKYPDLFKAIEEKEKVKQSNKTRDIEKEEKIIIGRKKNVIEEVEENILGIKTESPFVVSGETEEKREKSKENDITSLGVIVSSDAEKVDNTNDKSDKNIEIENNFGTFVDEDFENSFNGQNVEEILDEIN